MKPAARGAVSAACVTIALACSVAACLSPAEIAYNRKLEQWTRGTHFVLFQGADMRLTVDATFLSTDFRTAYVARFAHDATLSPSEREATLAAAVARAQQDHEFYVALETQSRRWGDLQRPSSAWRVRLVNDRGQEVAPVRVEPVRRLSAAEREYFPYSSPWRQVFHVHFPRSVTVNGTEVALLAPGTRYFTLRFSGALGTADLRWDVAPGAVP